MGQQQLLLLVLGIVIVGIAIVVGINAYAENSVKSNYDAILQDALRMASDAQAWKSKPELFGGQDDTRKTDQADFTDANFGAWGYSAQNMSSDGLCYVNLNGQFDITQATTAGLKLHGQSVQHENAVEVTVLGTLEPDITITDQVQGDQDVVNGGNGAFTALTTCTTQGS